MKTLIKALAGFQEECPTFVKTTEGFKYKYVELNEIIKTVTPILRTYGLMVHQQSVTTGEYIGVKTTLVHIETGEELSSELTMPLSELNGMNLYQSAGSAITYIRRYDMSNLLGLITEKDDDAGAGKGSKRFDAPKQKVIAPKPQPEKAVTEKIKLNQKSEKWNDAVKYVKAGGKIDVIKSKYEISDADADELVKQSKND